MRLHGTSHAGGMNEISLLQSDIEPKTRIHPFSLLAPAERNPMTPKECKRICKRLTREGLLTQVGVRDGEPLYSLAPVEPAIEALAVLAETDGYDLCSEPRAWVANALRQRADLRDMPEAMLLGFLSVALLQRGCLWGSEAAWFARNSVPRASGVLQ
jgi:hypothetical protein